MNKQALKTEAAEIRNRLDEIDRLLEGNEYPDGTPGYFWDEDYEDKRFGYLKNGWSDHFQFGFFKDQALTKPFAGFKYFEPIKEAILPMPIEHDGGEYPGNPKDFVITYYKDGSFGPKRASETTWVQVKSYQVIRRHDNG